VITVISSLEIQNLRGIREGKLDELTPLVVLVGPNGSGKSTILDALFIGASQHPGQAALEAIQRHPGIDEGARWIVWLGSLSESAQVSVFTHTGDSRTLNLRSNTNGGVQVLVKVPAVSSFPMDAEGFGSAVLAIDGVSDVRLVEPRGFNGTSPLHRLFTEAVRQGRRDEARNIVSDLIPHAKNLEILTEADKPIVHVVFDDHSVPVAFAGDGIYSLVRLSLELASRPSGVVLIEEPEIHQHPAAIARSVRAILGAVHRGIQIIITTHSLELIDSMLAEALKEDLEKLSVYRLSLDQGMLKSRRIPGSEVNFLRTEIEDDLR
jgi:predicted ATPase